MHFNYGDAFTENAEAIQSQVLPEGEYDVEVKSAKPVTTQGGKPAIKMMLVVLSGPHAGRTLPNQQTWSPESDIGMRMFRQAMEMLGASKEWIVSTNASGDQIADRIVGGRARVFVKEGEFNGIPRNDVTFKRALATTENAPAGAYVGGPANTTDGGVPSWP